MPWRARDGKDRPAEHHGARRVLVSAGLPRACPGSGATFPHSPQAELQRLGHQPDSRRLRGHGVSAPRARAGNFEERQHEDHRTTAGRCDASGEPPPPQSGGAERDKAVRRPAERHSAEALLALGEKAETTQTIRIVPTPLYYWICTTFPRERRYRAWFLKKHEEMAAA